MAQSRSSRPFRLTSPNKFKPARSFKPSRQSSAAKAAGGPTTRAVVVRKWRNWMRLWRKRKVCLGEIKNEQKRTKETKKIHFGAIPSSFSSLPSVEILDPAMLPDEQPSPEQIKI